MHEDIFGHGFDSCEAEAFLLVVLDQLAALAAAVADNPHVTTSILLAFDRLPAVFVRSKITTAPTFGEPLVIWFSRMMTSGPGVPRSRMKPKPRSGNHRTICPFVHMLRAS